MAYGWDSMPFLSVYGARRKLSYMRCSPTSRLLAASVFLFLTVCVVLFRQTPPECPPCGDRQKLPESDAPIPSEKPVELKNIEDTTKGPSAVTEEAKSPVTEPPPVSKQEISLLSKDEAKKLNLADKPKATKAPSKPRKFRNPPVPERPVISEAEQAKHRLAVIIPYRDRMDNLKVFVPTVGNILRQQKIIYSIYVVEQTDAGAFNRGKLCNIGYSIAKADGFDYIAIHDVDKVPVSANVSYRWPGETFVHMATCVEQFKWELPYYNFLGGVVMFRMDHYAKFNGMTNIFWGFGAEDDDLWVRIKRARIKISRAKACHMGRFTSLDHGNSSLYYPKVDYLANYNLYRQLLKRRRKMDADGLSTLEYTLLKRTSEPLGYINLHVDVCKGSLGRATIEETGCDGPKPRPSPKRDEKAAAMSKG